MHYFLLSKARVGFGPLLADVDGYRRIARRTPAAPTYDATDLVWVLALLLAPLAIAGLVKVVRRLRDAVRQRSPLGLFLELCRAHGLKRRQQWRLWQLTRQVGIVPPTQLFVNPQCLDNLLARGAKTPFSPAELGRLRTAFFGDLPPLRS